MKSNLNKEVSRFLDDLNHPLRTEIDELRLIILDAVDGLAENIKWNGPNYTHHQEDRITMRVQPPGKIQLIFHRGAKKLVQPPARLIDDPSGLLVWKENDRAIASFKNPDDIKNRRSDLTDIIAKWLDVTK